MLHNQVYLDSKWGKNQQIKPLSDGALLSKVMILDGTKDLKLLWTIRLLGELMLCVNMECAYDMCLSEHL